MKKLFLILFFVPFVFAAIAGETEVIYSIPNCFEHILINVTGEMPIESGEYEILGCDNISTNFWSCDCENPTDIKLRTQLTTINTYDFEILWYTETGPQIIYVPTGGGSSGGGGGGGGYILTPEQAARWKGETLDPEPEIIYKDREIIVKEQCDNNDTCNIPPQEIVEKVVEKEVIVEKKNPATKYVLAVLGLVIFGLLWYIWNKLDI